MMACIIWLNSQNLHPGTENVTALFRFTGEVSNNFWSLDTTGNARIRSHVSVQIHMDLIVGVWSYMLLLTVERPKKDVNCGAT